MPRLKNKGKLIKIQKLITTKIKTKSGQIKTIRKLNSYWVDPNKKSFKKMKENVDYFLDQPSNRYNQKNIRHKIETDKDYAMEAFLFLYEFQTDTEKNFGRTIFKNNVGFNKPDGIFVADFVRRIRNYRGFRNWEKVDPRGFQRAIDGVQRRMPKYSRQLADILNGNNRWRQFTLPKDVIAKKAKEFNLTSVAKPQVSKSNKKMEFKKPENVEVRRGKPTKRKRLVTTDGIISSVEKSSTYGLQLLHMYRSIQGDSNIRPFYEQYLGRGIFKLSNVQQLQIDHWIRQYAKGQKFSLQDRADIKTLAMRHAREIAGILNVNKLFGPGVTKLESAVDNLSKKTDVKLEKLHDIGITKATEVVSIDGFMSYDELTKTKNFDKLIREFSSEAMHDLKYYENFTKDEYGSAEDTFIKIKSFIKHVVENDNNAEYIWTRPAEFMDVIGHFLNFTAHVAQKHKKIFDPFSGIDWSKKFKDQPALFYYASASVLKANKHALKSDNQQMFGNTSPKEFAKMVDSLWKPDDPQSITVKTVYSVTNSSYTESILDEDYYNKFSQMIKDLNMPHTVDLYNKYYMDTGESQFYTFNISSGIAQSDVISKAYPDKKNVRDLARHLNRTLKYFVDHDVVYRPDKFLGSKIEEEIRKTKLAIGQEPPNIYFESIKPKAQTDLYRRMGKDDDFIKKYFQMETKDILENQSSSSNQANSILLRRSVRNVLGLHQSNDFDYLVGDIYPTNLRRLKSEDLDPIWVDSLKTIYNHTQDYLNSDYAKQKLDIKEVGNQTVLGKPLYRGNYLINVGKHATSVDSKLFLLAGTISTTEWITTANEFSQASSDFLPVKDVLDHWKQYGADVKIQKNFEPYLRSMMRGHLPEHGYVLELNNVPTKSVVISLDDGGKNYYLDNGILTGWGGYHEGEFVVVI